ncbi:MULTISPECIES: hypothetical protein [Haemophilus]|uniref:HP1 n=2 Tax=Haemophilus TaxID=724 RepID=A0ABY1VV20_HAEAE|nr:MULTISPECIES: hypothetical protein [Haemophilus]OBX85148.1 hypothetical protein A9520_07560 [Haemophilus aegyptius]TMQ45792.1 hypothetical protein AO054_00500 [Haemophilus influenzae biotype aegyptius]UAK81930.1 hypothetical protein K8O83_06345 [Haemophilus aegyptius]UAK83150.1 hypothetical protein K8O83_03100 [Haemophilus aegyptius]SQH36430.1 HP1 [Haemophilus aegyptius]
MTMYFKNGFFDDTDGGFVPESAVEISQETYLELLNGQAQGKQIITDKTGYPVLIDPQPSAAHVLNLDTLSWEVLAEKQTALLADTQTRLIANIDEHAAKIYSTWTRFESEYRERQAVAEAFKAANYEGECSRYITDFAQRARLDNKTATNLILTQAAGLEKLQVELANQRMRKYELKAPNLTLEQLQSIYDDIIKQMDNLMEAYQNG